jgi:hypothetical protein
MQTVWPKFWQDLSGITDYVKLPTAYAYTGERTIVVASASLVNLL